MKAIINAIKGVANALTRISRRKQTRLGNLKGVKRGEIDVEIEILIATAQKLEKEDKKIKVKKIRGDQE